jgi:O-antigen/teichoic acid export membrane protein
VLTSAAAVLLLTRLARKDPHNPSDSTSEARASQRDGRRHLRDAFRFGIQAWVGNILQQANYRLDLLVLGAYASARHVGVYSVAVTITAVGWILPHGLQTVLFPRAARLDAAASEGQLSAEESDAAVARATRHSVLLLVPSAVIVACLLALVPLVYGRKFDETVVLGLILLPGVLVLAVGKVLGSVISGRGKPRYMLYVGIASAVVTIALYFILIPIIHEWGAASASTVSYVLTTVILLGFFRRVTPLPLRTALVPTRADVKNYLEAAGALRAHFRARSPRRHAV